MNQCWIQGFMGPGPPLVHFLIHGYIKTIVRNLSASAKPNYLVYIMSSGEFLILLTLSIYNYTFICNICPNYVMEKISLSKLCPC